MTAPSDEVVRYRLAAASDRSAAFAMLEAERLPTSDIATSGVALIVAETTERIVGVIGIEPRGRTGIIRSLAVIPKFRGKGIARSLVARAEALAAGGGLRAIFLLTDGAAAFWERAGYTRVPRMEAPREIQASAEFAALCPAAATCMKRMLSGPMVKAGEDALSLQPDPSGARFWELALACVRLTYYQVPPGAFFPQHRHDGEQITYVLDGELVFEGGGEKFSVAAGEAILVPAGEPHAVTAGPAGANAVDAWSHPLATELITDSTA